MNDQWIQKLQQTCPDVEVRAAEPMAQHVSFRIGGPAAAMAFPKSEDQLACVLRFCRKNGCKPVILGAGTNVLPRDEGLDALVICLRDGLTALRRLDGNRLEVGAGVTMARAAEFACREGLTGLEFAHGIPGTMGGGLFMNAGAYGGELCQVAQETAVMDYDGQIHILAGSDQGFGYRTSAFQTMEGVIVRTVLQLQPGDEGTIRETMKELARRRRESQPLNLPSAGSTFKRPVGGYAAALIDGAGLRGLRVGGASVSEKHAGFVVNDDGATCEDVLRLIAEVQKRVWEHSGIRLEPEVRLL